MRTTSWRLLLHTSLAIIIAGTALTARQVVTGLQCPASIAVDERTDAPAGWVADPAKVSHRFEGIDVYNGPMGEHRRQAPTPPAQLAPDRQAQRSAVLVQTWELEAYRNHPILLVCRYEATGVVVAREVPPSITICEQRFEYDSKRGVIKNPRTPPSMACR